MVPPQPSRRCAKGDFGADLYGYIHPLPYLVGYVAEIRDNLEEAGLAIVLEAITVAVVCPGQRSASNSFLVTLGYSIPTQTFAEPSMTSS